MESIQGLSQDTSIANARSGNEPEGLAKRLPRVMRSKGAGLTPLGLSRRGAGFASESSGTIGPGFVPASSHEPVYLSRLGVAGSRRTGQSPKPGGLENSGHPAQGNAGSELGIESADARKRPTSDPGRECSLLGAAVRTVGIRCRGVAVGALRLHSLGATIGTV